MPTPAAAQTRVNSLLDEAAKAADGAKADLSHDARQALKADLDRIRHFFADEFDRDGALGAAVFCGSLDGIWIARELVAPVPDRAVIGSKPLLAPLARVVDQGGGALVVMASREQGRFYELRDGRLEQVVDLSDRQPRRHDQGGWSQARMQRHIDELASEHLREVAAELDRRVRGRSDVALVVVSPEETWAELSALLSQDVRGALAGWTHAEAHSGPTELLEVALPVLERARRRRARAPAGSLAGGGGPRGPGERRLGRHARGRVRRRASTRCSRAKAPRGRPGVAPGAAACGAEEGPCPLDGIAMELVEDGLDAAVHQTLARGGTIRIASGSQALDPVEGVGALLRF